MSAPGKKVGAGCLTLFALLFAGVGVGMTAWLLWTLFRIALAQTWVETPARILEASLEGGDTSRALARYAYTFAGSDYEGTRVSFYQGADNIGSFQQDAYRELTRYVAKAEPDGVEKDARAPAGPRFHCYVNPHRPAESVLYRHVRIGMTLFQLMFGLIFGAVGFGLMFGSRFAARKARKKQLRAGQFPGEPWKWREDWASGLVRADSSGTMFALFFACFWNAISFPCAFSLIPPALKAGQRAVLFLAIFPIVGIFLAVWAVREMMRKRRFGRSTLQLTTLPGVLGGKLAGLIRLSAKVRAEGGFHVKVKCTRTVTTGSGDDRRSQEDVLWEEEQVIAADLARDPTQTALPLLFALPFDQPPTDPESAYPVAWRVEVTARNPGIDLDVRFDVPVFKTAESAPDFKFDDASIRPYLTPVDPREVLRDARVRVEQTAFGPAWVFPPARFLGQAVVLTLVTAIWTGAVAWMIAAKRQGHDLPAALPAVFGFFDVLLLGGVLDAWLGAGRIEVARGTLRWRRGLLGLGRRKELAGSEVGEISAVPGSRSGNEQRYIVAAFDRAGKKLTLSRELPNKRAAEALIAEIQKALGRG